MSHSKKYFAVFTLLAAALTQQASAGLLTSASSADYVPGEVLVRFKNGVDEAAKQRAFSPWGVGQELSRLHLHKVRLKSGFSVENAAAQLNQNSSVDWAQPNYIYHAHLNCAPPGEFSAGYTPALGTPAGHYAWPLVQIHALNSDFSTPVTSAWGYLQSQCSSITAPVTVAVLDTGVASNNPDLPPSLFLTGFNALTGTSNSQDDFGHGTMVAGVIAGLWNNAGPTTPAACGTGPYSGAVAGVAGMPGLVQIIPIKVLDNTGSGTTQNIIDGTNYAVAHGAKILNFSLGAIGPDAMEGAAITAALNAGCVVIASAGNDATVSRIKPLDYPAGYPGVIAAGATDANGNMTYYSNAATAAGNFNLMAPGGGNVCGGTGSNPCFDPDDDYFGAQLCPATNTEFDLSPSDSNYGTASGTSFSAPTITGAAVLILALHPNWSAAEIAAQFRLTSTAMSVYTHTHNSGLGLYGRLNLAAALSTTFLTFTPTVTRTPTATSTATRTFTNSPTRTATSTFSPTSTFTPTKTYTSTATNSFTSTATNSPTPTNTLTFTATATSTFTSTFTFTNTSTHTSTPSFTDTATNSPTPTSTNTSTFTPTNTPSDTPSATLTFTPSSTPTWTNTFSFTPTATDSSTPSFSATPSASPTDSFSPTSSNTSTDSTTPTPSATSTDTPAYSNTSTPTATNSTTPTPSPTDADTATLTPTSSLTFTPSNTPTETNTSTLTATDLITPTSSATDSTTPTPSATLTASATPTPTSILIFTATLTPTPAPSQPFSISLPYPNPSGGSAFHWDIETMDALKLEMSVFTVKDREILEKIFFITGNSTVTWDLKEKNGRPAANGVYFVRFRMTGGSTTDEKIFKVVVLK